MTVFGLDYSSGRPSHAAMKTAGVSFVCRYIGSQVHGTGRSAKWLTPSEATALHVDGFDVVAVFETTAQRAEGGAAAGTADAHTAVAELAYCGLPADLPVYWAVDYDTTVGPHLRAYFKAIAAVLGIRRVGVYAGYKVVKVLLDEHLVTYAWQTYAWSGGKWDTRAQIQQYSNGKTVGGASVDYDRAMHAEFGQWPAKVTPPPAPQPKAWPGRYLKLASPLMHGSDVTWAQQRLNAHGSKLTADGQYGPKTAAAVRAFQKAKHLTADGIVGKATWTALGKS
jgi:hypothetical protein